MHLKRPSLVDVCRRAGLSLGQPAIGEGADADQKSTSVTCRSPAWGDLDFTVVAPSDVFMLSLEQAASDVDDLFPGRNRVDGAIALLSTALQAAVESRLSPPEIVALVGPGSWTVTPPETWPSAEHPPQETEWHA